MEMTQDDFKFLTGMTTNYTATQWATIVAAAATRLASFLCLDALPETMPADLEEAFANFIAAVITNHGANGEVESKHVRNFTVNFRASTAANAFARIAQQYGDVIERYSDCSLGVDVCERAPRCCR